MLIPSIHASKKKRLTFLSHSEENVLSPSFGKIKRVCLKKKKSQILFRVICSWSSHDETMNSFISNKDEGRPHLGSQWVSQASHTAQDGHHPSFPQDSSCLGVLIAAITGVSHQVWPITEWGSELEPGHRCMVLLETRARGAWSAFRTPWDIYSGNCRR